MGPGHGRPVGEPLTGHRDAVWDAAFSPDGSLLATAGGTHTIRPWTTPVPQRNR
ncbi:WD40 repeat domain-containing protein [Streptomyces sp. NBC_01410]|uniref:WD40 repeat domain-containing protein n=1 Tax=Streptomyces sp. NBC_01410 TaxID=2903856 RepID=UPI0038639525